MARGRESNDIRPNLLMMYVAERALVGFMDWVYSGEVRDFDEKLLKYLREDCGGGSSRREMALKSENDELRAKLREQQRFITELRSGVAVPSGASTDNAAQDEGASDPAPAGPDRRLKPNFSLGNLAYFFTHCRPEPMGSAGPRSSEFKMRELGDRLKRLSDHRNWIMHGLHRANPNKDLTQERLQELLIEVLHDVRDWVQIRLRKTGAKRAGGRMELFPGWRLCCLESEELDVLIEHGRINVRETKIRVRDRKLRFTPRWSPDDDCWIYVLSEHVKLNREEKKYVQAGLLEEAVTWSPPGRRSPNGKCRLEVAAESPVTPYEMDGDVMHVPLWLPATKSDRRMIVRPARRSKDASSSR